MLQLYQSKVNLILILNQKYFFKVFLICREIDVALQRISKMIRGIGDPLVGAYARCYLIKVGLRVGNNRDFMKESFVDFLATYHTVKMTSRNVFFQALKHFYFAFRFSTLEFELSC